MSQLKKIFLSATIAVVAVGVVMPAGSASALTADELQAQINTLLAQLQALQSQLTQTQGTPSAGTGACAGITFTRNLSVGSSGTDVKCLQSILNMSADTQVAASGVGSAGNESMYFGNLTKAAVVKFQNKYAAEILTPVGLSAGTGFVGASTRAKLNTMVGAAPSPAPTPTPTPTPGTPPPPPPVTTGAFTVSLASDTPAASTVVDGQGFAPLAKFVFSNGTSSVVKVTNLKLKRLGVSADASLTNVYLFEGEKRLTDSATVASGIITFNASNGIFTVAANSSKTVIAGADIDGTSGETVGLGITAASDITADATVSGSFPLNGNLMTLATATLAGVALAGDSNTTPSANTSLNPQNDFTVWQNATSVTTRSIDFKRISFRNIGSVDGDDLQNFRFYIDGVQVGSAVNLLDADGYVTFDVSSAPKRLETGTRTLKLVADIIAGSSKTFRFSVRVAADVTIVDTQYGVNVLATETSGSFPVQAGQQTIASGTITMTKKATSLSGNVVNTASAVAMATYEVKAAGEAVKIESLRVSFSATNSGDTAQTDMDELRNGQVYANGVQIGSTADIFEDSHTTTYTTYNLGSSLIVQPGSPVELVVRADIFDSDGTNDITAGDKLRINIEGGDIDNAIGQVSGTTIDAPAADVNANFVSVATGGLTLSKYTAFPNTTYVLPLTAKKLGHFVLSANTTEAVNLNTITVDYVTADDTNLTNLFVKFGPSGSLQETAAKATVSTTSSGEVTSQANDFSVSYTMPIGQSIHLEVYGNVSSAESATSARMNMQITGVTANSATTVYGTGSAAATRVEGQTLTYGTGTFTVAKDGTSPITSVIAGNQTATNAKLKFTSQNEDNTLTELFLKMASGASAIVNKAILKDGSTVLASLPFGTNADSDSNSITDSVNFTGLSVPVPAGSSKVLTVDFELGDPSTNFSTSGLALQLTVDEMVYLKSTGVKTTDATPGIGGTNPTGNTQIVFKGYPLITADNAGLSGIFVNGSTTELYKWKVKATGGSLAMKQFKFAVAFTDVNTRNLKVDQFTLFRGSTNITGDVTMRETNGNSVEGTSFAVSETAVNGSSDVLFISWDDDKEDAIGSGEEVTYTLKGVPAAFNSASGSKDSVAFTLVADNEESAGVVRKFIARDATLNTLELGATVGLTTGDVSDLIWSDVSSTAHDPDETAAGSGSGDWHDGYLIEQLNLGSKAWSL
ncbi:MAG: hypothetical protein A3A27_01785 [Candidatus Wildermuthbacteria bacterium RIFCSPLOWO2_01_FULL_47_18]|uniref:Peptidoglycan binding-like domain-containing protein n=2 Tax=Candidatus Wildermuthiibacteriota TaxID=1817923 RepID=A0A1G2RK50_9BACT|nr:MAG: hypothetical protein A3J68_00480 [Candidatus Wildermuthbacteria bacterium RIFCSPHIGHO2_02_FULL_48_16]OHA72411.1 MAG: hypothetical protein A3A27_01785 [Candidatus Wildermuthbacteria bacterium RIFCSPLOWO2_01_FULL_47_18]